MATWTQRFLHAIQNTSTAFTSGQSKYKSNVVLFLILIVCTVGTAREGGQGTIQERCTKGANRGRSTNYQSRFWQRAAPHEWVGEITLIAHCC
jgi:hypothetical protein